MTPPTIPISLSPLDEERFGIRTARCVGLTLETLPEALAFCEEQSVALLIARCLVDRLDAVQAMERCGFSRWTRSSIGASTWHAAVPDDRRLVESLARQIFRDYGGHYHADPNLDPAACDEVYVDWAVRSLLARDGATEVLIGALDGVPVAFQVLRATGADEGENVLGGVTPAAQGQGLYRWHMIAGLEWMKRRNLRRMVVSSQITNLAVQKVWSRLGLEPNRAYYTFHRWFRTGAATERP